MGFKAPLLHDAPLFSTPRQSLSSGGSQDPTRRTIAGVVSGRFVSNPKPRGGRVRATSVHDLRRFESYLGICVVAKSRLTLKDIQRVRSTDVAGP